MKVRILLLPFVGLLALLWLHITPADNTGTSLPPPSVENPVITLPSALPVPLPGAIYTPSPASPDTDDGYSSFEMIFTGDVLLDSSVYTLIARDGITAPISQGLMEALAAADFTGINLETPFSNRGTPAPDKQYTFRSKPETVKLLELMGVDFCALGNNHVLDYGVDAMMDTLELLDARGIGHSGAGENLEAASRPSEHILGGRTVAVLSASRVVPTVSWHATQKSPGMLTTYDPANLLKAIEKSKESSELCVVFVHWGVERSNTPEKYQRDLAHKYIDAGADLVIGSHPHVLQGFEYYKGKLIAYSLGNFIFTSGNLNTAVLSVTADKNGALSASVIPCRIVNRTTDFMPESEHKALFHYLSGISYGAQVGDDGAIRPLPQS